MSRPLVLIHGYSDDGGAFYNLGAALRAQGVDASNINIAKYISLNNEITIRDLAEGLERAFENNEKLKHGEDFDAIVHSTGMLVLRSWLTNISQDPDNQRVRRLKHLVGLAPATWGSPQGSKGRSWLGAVIKGNRQFGPDFMDAGNEILFGLELGSKFTWDLAHIDLLGPKPFYDLESDTPFVAVFIGNRGYQGAAAVANDPGTDGTVRWAGCGLNARKITIDLTKSRAIPGAITITPWAGRLDIPMIAVDDRDHGSLINNPDPEMVRRIAQFLNVNDAAAHQAWVVDAIQWSGPAKQKMLEEPRQNFLGWFGGGTTEPLEGWQEFVVHAVDERGDPIPDYTVEILRQEADLSWNSWSGMLLDVHSYERDKSFKSFQVQVPQGISDPATKLRLRITASSGTDLIAFQSFDDTLGQTTKPGDPVELDVTFQPDAEGTLFYPFTTTLVEIIFNREPTPFEKLSRILTWDDDTAQRIRSAG